MGAGKLLAADGIERWRALEATTFMATEIHRNFIPVFRSGSAQEKAAAAAALLMRFVDIASNFLACLTCQHRRSSSRHLCQILLFVHLCVMG